MKWPCGKCILLWSETGATSTMGGTEEAAVAMDAQPEVYYFPAGRTEGEERERERERRGRMEDKALPKKTSQLNKISY